LFYGIISIYIKNKYNILVALKKRILYIILGLMLFANVGVGQGFISFNGIQNYIYNGSPQFTRTSLVIDYGTSDDDSPITVYSYSGNSFSGTPYGPSPNKPINAGNYTVTATVTFNDISGSFNSLPVSFTIAKATPILTVTNPTLTYTANTQSATVSSSVAGTFPTALKYNGSTTNPTNAGTYTITADFTPNDAANYNSLIGESAGNFTINKAPITISDILLTKNYDGTSVVNVISNSPSGIFSSDDIVIIGNATNFSNKIVANNYTSTVTFSLTTSSASGKENNYFILGGNQKLISNGTITKLPITLTASANTKVYDGTVSATSTPTITIGALVSGDVGVFSETYDTKTQGLNKVLTPTVVSILDATNTSMIGNYSITYQTNANGVITKLPITLTASANTKVYDGTVSATATPTITTGSLVSGDVGVFSETYDTKTQGSNKVLTPTVVSILDATNASMIGNYSITYTSVNTGVIEKRPITLTASTNTKVYDGTVSASATPTITTGALVSGDVGVFSETYDTKIQGSNKVLTPTVISILDATNASMIGNYSITYINNSSGVIEKRPITLTANTNTKVYDGTLSSTATPTLTGALGSGDVGVYSQTYDSKTQGSNKVLTPTVVSILDATNASMIGNYSITYTSVNTGVIEKLPITLTASTNTKVYDGTVSATATPTITTGALVSGDVGVFSETYDTKTQGSNKVLTPTVVSILDATNTSMIGNYSITYETNTSGVITAKQLTITDPLINKTKEYDKTLTANTTAGTLSGVLTRGSATDAVTVSSVGTYSTSSVGTGKTITVSYTLDGVDKDNYIKPVDKVYTDGVITPKQLTITDPTITKSKEYDKTVTVNTTAGTLSGVVTVGSATDAVTVSSVGTYSTSTVGTSKTITVSYTLDGVDKENYIKPVDKVYTDGVITAKQLTITDPLINKTKEYDKTLTANTTAGTLSGVVTVGSATDAVTVSSVGTYSTSTVGTSKTITVVYTLDGADKDNYIKPVDKVYTDGVITAKQLTITDPTITKSKEYDKTVTVNTTAGTLSGVVTVGSVTDAVTAQSVGTYSTSSVGTGKTITVSYTLDGVDKDNYIKPLDKVYTDGVITAKPLTVTGVTTSNKVYDGTNIATLTGGTLVGVISPDVVNFTASGTFSQSTVGTGISIKSTSTIDNRNYSLTQPTLTARDITAKPLTITAKPGQTKVFGTPDPPNFTYILSAPLFGSDVLTGALKRDVGEAVGKYAINQGTLTNLNYGITYISNNFEITPAPINNTGSPFPFAVPNAFTPNGDGKNDKFKIIFNNTTGVTLRLQIYNRNGILMFSTSDISEDWDGRYKDVMQDMGIYFVKYRIEIAGGKIYEDTPRLYLLK
jgi:gliding motility-associated-like protein